jgi:hypothetical protein
VLWRPAAALVTGPIAFFVAGVIDLAAFGVAIVRDAIRKLVGSGAPSGEST